MTTTLANVEYRPTDLTTDRLGQVLVKSGFFADTRDEAQAIVKILAGRELGFGPIASMQGVYIVKGRVSLSANLVGAAIQRSGKYRYDVVSLTNDACVLRFSTSGGHSTFESSFTIEDAKAASLLSDNYRKFPRNMLFSRALTNGARWFCPEVFNGPIYTPDELGADVDDDGRVVETTGQAVPYTVDRQSGEVLPPPAAPEKMVTSTKDRLYVRYAELAREAEALGVEFEMVEVPITEARMKELGSALVEAIEKKRLEETKPEEDGAF